MLGCLPMLGSGYLIGIRDEDPGRNVEGSGLKAESSRLKV